MPKKTDRQYRILTAFQAPTEQKKIQSDYYTEGYATTFEPYLLYKDYTSGQDIYELFLPEAFNDCDMSDIIMQYDHTGKVYARKSNGTLIVEPNEYGLHICADLSKSEAARELYNEIKSGLITKMSWSFISGESYYDESRRTIIHKKISKIYDVSAVSIPANDDTEINARNFVDGEIDKVTQELRKRAKQKLLLKIKLEVKK